MIDKLTRLEDNLKTLQSIKTSFTVDDILTDKIDEWGLRYGLLESIQIIIDIGCHIVAEKNLGTPKNYSECISFLAANNYITGSLSDKLRRMIGLRNLLVHDYGIIDARKLYEYLDHLDDMNEFIYAVGGRE